MYKDGCDSRVTCTCGVSLNESFGKSLFIGKLYGIDCFRFLEDDCLAERVSSAWHRVAGGVTRETDLIVSTLGARCAGHEARARARPRRREPRPTPRRPSPAAPRMAERARSENVPSGTFYRISRRNV